MLAAEPMGATEEKLSDALKRLLAAADGRGLTVAEMVEILSGRGLNMIIMLLCLPFLSPVSLPGISIPFGMAIAFCGARIALGKKPWLPGWVMGRSVPHRVLEKMVGWGVRFHSKIEKIVRPRMEALFHGAGHILLGSAIALGGFYLSLPIPPPFPLTNTIPGFAIILLSFGLMERDGALVIAGYALLVVATIYLATIAAIGGAGALQLINIFSQKPA